jgi:antitoxin (DNA-binding transcriptional repressor) of toxin-antitoxin stability system
MSGHVEHTVNIAKFKAEMGKYLNFVRKGDDIIVLDRKESIARVIPAIKENPKLRLKMEPATASTADFLAIEIPPSTLDIDVLQVLLEERGDR